jgi:hypothetical protein
MHTVHPPDPWQVFDYEVDMFRNLCQLLKAGNSQYQSLSHYIKCAIVESAVLHTRILVDVLLSRSSEQDDITLLLLAPTFKCSAIDQLRQSYGNRSQADSPCWAFNKKLAHATSQRTDRYDYSAQLNQLVPLINDIVDQVNAQRL